MLRSWQQHLRMIRLWGGGTRSAEEPTKVVSFGGEWKSTRDWWERRGKGLWQLARRQLRKIRFSTPRTGGLTTCLARCLELTEVLKRCGRGGVVEMRKSFRTRLV
jgi:hypothetical protein